MAEPRARSGSAPELAVGAFLIAAALPLARLFVTGEALGIALLTIAAALGASVGLARVRLGVLASWAVSTLILAWYVSLLFFRDTLWGPFPTVSTMRALGATLDEAGRIVMQETAPIRPVAAVLVLVAIGVWQTAWLVHAAAVRLRAPVLAIAGALPLFALPGLFLASTRRWLEIGLFLAAAGWLLYEDERTRVARWAVVRAGGRAAGWHPGAAARLGLAAAVVAVVLAPMLPGFTLPPGPERSGSGGRVYFNPLVAVRPTLDNDEERTLFTVRATKPTYYRLTALDHFDGSVWSQKVRRRLASDSPLVRGPVVREELVRQEFQIDALAGPWIPAAQRPVRYSSGFRWTPESGTLTFSGGLRRNLTYSIISRHPEPTPRALRAEDAAYPRDLQPYLELPRRTPREVRELAARITAGARTQYDRAVLLQEHLRAFTYDENVAASHSFDSLVEFLTDAKRGYCEQFAAAMAVMARTLGIPSRVVVGFGYGEALGDDTYRITTRHAHSWVEIYFPRAGWIAFEPTPRGGVAPAPDYSQPEQTPGATASPGTPGASDRPSDRDRAEPSAGPSARDRAGENGGAGRPDAPVLPGLLTVALVLAVAVVGALALVAARRALVRWRKARAPSPKAAVVLEYQDFLGWCAAAGLGRRPGETPREHARRLAIVAPDAATPLSDLAETVGAVLWAPANGHDPAAVARLTHEARTAIARTLPARRRTLATLGWGRRSAA